MSQSGLIARPLAVVMNRRLRSVDAGMTLADAAVVMREEKTVRRVTAVSAGGSVFPAYEIHMGQTTVRAGVSAFATVNGRPEGARFGRCRGTYLHDALRSDATLAELGLQPASQAECRDRTFDRLAGCTDLRLYPMG